MTAGVGLAEELGALDGVVVASSTNTHPAFALQIARAGVPTLVEKPLALDPEQLTALADQLDDIGTEVMVAFHADTIPAISVRQRILAGEAGTVRAVTATDMIILPPRIRSCLRWIVTCSSRLRHDPVGHWPCPQVWATGSVLDAVHAIQRSTQLGGVGPKVWSCRHGERLRRNGAGQDVGSRSSARSTPSGLASTPARR